MEEPKKSFSGVKDGLREFWSIFWQILASPLFWPYLWLFIWRKNQNKTKARLDGKLATESRAIVRWWYRRRLGALKWAKYISWPMVFLWFPLLWYMRAVIHPVALVVTVKTPLVLLGIVTLIVLTLYIRSRNTNGGRIGALLVSVAITIGIGTGGPWLYEYLWMIVNYNDRVVMHELEKLPLTDHEKIHGRKSLHIAADKEHVDDTKDVIMPHLVRLKDDNYYQTTQSEVSKEKWVQFLFEHPEEVFLVPVDDLSPKLSRAEHQMEDVEFTFGQYLWFSNDSRTAAIKRLSWSQYFRYEPSDEIIIMQDDAGEWVQVVPITKWEGMLFPMPTFGGVIVHHEGIVPYGKKVLFGGGEFIPAERIGEHEYLRGQSLTPASVGLAIAKTFRVHESVWAPIPGNHKGDVQIPRLESNFADFPFQEFFRMSEVVDALLKHIAYDGVYQYIPLEVYGNDKSLLKISLFIRGDDATHIFFYDHTKEGEGISGPSIMAQRVHEGLKEYDWTFARVTEQTPLIKDVYGKRRLFWKTNIQTMKTDILDNGDTISYPTFGTAEMVILDALERQVFIHKQGSEMLTRYWQGYLEEALMHEKPETSFPRQFMEEVEKIILPPVDEGEKDTVKAEVANIEVQIVH